MADAYPNFCICGIPYYVSGEVGHWSDIAHRTLADLKATDTLATGIDASGRRQAAGGWPCATPKAASRKCCTAP
ncbi:hypothetical protein ACF1G5_33570 [Streptomyces coeruleorubidus]|uniref:hypothetical protein n=1 Tax=Streptomyces coeruleorubidus TaxID=116188 RepID=UPI003702E651